MIATAKENIYLNGAILGHSREVMDRHYEDVVEFSELRDFMDVPVKIILPEWSQDLLLQLRQLALGYTDCG